MSQTKNSITAEFLLEREDGSLVDSSKHSGDLNYIEGLGMMAPGIEQALSGLEAGSEFNVLLPPAQMYGERNEELQMEVSAADFNGQASELEPGMVIQAETGAGPRLMTVKSIDGEKVILDTNHPLAGVTLRFSGTLKQVRPMSQEEIDALTKSGCGCGGHEHGDDHECCGGTGGDECCGGGGDEGGCGCGGH